MSEISNNNEYIPRAERRNKDGLTEKEFLEQYTQLFNCFAKILTYEVDYIHFTFNCK